MLMDALIMYLNVTSADIVKSYSFFSSRSECVRCNRHNTAFSSFKFHLDHQLIMSLPSHL